MLAIQQFFNQHKRAIVIAMSIAVIVALLVRYAIAPWDSERESTWTATSSLLYVAVSVIGLLPLITKAVSSLKFKVVSIELLVSVAVLGALAISEFSEAGIVTWLFLLGEVIEDTTLAKTRSAIRELTEMAPQTAQRISSPTDRAAEEVDVDEIDVGDYLLVTTGSQVPVDGHIVFGDGHLDEASVTGEPLPQHKSANGSGTQESQGAQESIEAGPTDGKKDREQVFAGTNLIDGTIVVQADHVGEDTVFGSIIELVEEAEDSKTAAQRFIDRFARYYTPVVLIVALIVGIVTRDARLAITILVLGCPGALVIGVPVSNVAGIGLGARHGILAKGAQVLQTLSGVDTVVFDKTGTLTAGHPSVVSAQAVGAAETWRLVASAEHESTHPLAKAMVDYALAEYDIADYTAVTSTHVVAGKGLIAMVEGHRIAIGNTALMSGEGIVIPPHGTSHPSPAQNVPTLPNSPSVPGMQGLSSVYAAIDGNLRIAAGIGDPLRPTAINVLNDLRRRGITHLVMLSGDDQKAVDAVTHHLDLDEAHGGMLPQDKADFIARLQAKGHSVAFVGDGINDSPALITSDLGIAMGNGTATAVEISDIVLLHSDISKLPIAYAIARATVANTRENIGIALTTVLLLFTGLFAGFIYMASGMFVHEASILIVIANALRLLHEKLDVHQV